jgi:peptide/nickel transport system permease protein
MSSYLIKRLLLVIPTVILITMIVFLSVRFVPGDVIDLMVQDMASTAAMGTDLSGDSLRQSLGLDMPVHIQYLRWLGDIVHGDLGNSLWTRTSITGEVLKHLPVSMELGVMAILISMLISIPIGILSAVRQDSWADYIGRTVAVLAISLPGFWIATIVIVYPSVWWNWSPSIFYIPITKDFWGNIVQFIIPSAILGMVLSGTTMRMTRTMMLETLRQDYVRTAWSKGLSEQTIIVRHALRNALIPIVTIIGSMLPIIIGGSVVLEQIFSLPGIGQYMIEALNKRDYTVISGINLVVASFVLLINIIVDISYSWLDPRIRYT